jgi:hypothetical protein
MHKARIRFTAIVLSCALFVGAWGAVATWGSRTAPVSSAGQSQTPAIQDDTFEDDSFDSADTVQPVQTPVPTTQS